MASYTTNLPVNDKFNVTATFGQIGSYWKNGHKGIDITASNKKLYSVCDGEVTVVGFDKNGWGRYVSVKPDGFERIRFILCHMVENSVKVKKGDKVSRLTHIGTMGTTGNSSGVHVHVEMRIDNTSVDPSCYLLIPNKKGTGFSDTDFKFDAKGQKAFLSALLSEFDSENTAADTDAGAEKIKELETEISALKDKNTALQNKISAAVSALK